MTVLSSTMYLVCTVLPGHFLFCMSSSYSAASILQRLLVLWTTDISIVSLLSSCLSVALLSTHYFSCTTPLNRLPVFQACMDYEMEGGIM